MLPQKPDRGWLDFSHGLLTLGVVATIPILYAAVQPWVWSLYCLSMILAFIAALWTVGSGGGSLRVGRAHIPVALFFAWTLLLCLPLPHSILALISPTRSDLLVQTWLLTGLEPGWEAAGYASTRSLAWWLFLLSLGLFYTVVRNLCTETRMLKRVVGVMIAVGLVEAAYGLIQVLVPSMGVLTVRDIQAYLGSARGTFINRNNFAGFIEMIWPLALGATLAQTGRIASFRAALESDRLGRQVLSAVGVIILLLALIFTHSRAGIASGVVGLLVFSAMARAGASTPAFKTRVLLGGVIGGLSIYALAIGVGPVLERFLTIVTDGRFRLDVWRDSLPIIRDHPLGIGLRNYELVFPVYDQSPNFDLTVVFAHNDYLQLLIEAGWVGFLAVVAGLLIFLGRAGRRIRQLDPRRDPLRFYLAVGAFSGMISMAVHCLFDFNLQIPANCLYFVVLMAVLSACTVPYAGSAGLSGPSRDRPPSAGLQDDQPIGMENPLRVEYGKASRALYRTASMVSPTPTRWGRRW